MELQLPLDLKGGTAARAGDLETKFNKLSADSIAAHEQSIRAEDGIWKVLANGYLLWRELVEQRAVLDKLCTSAGFSTPQGQNAPDFATYAKLLFRLELPNASYADRERYLKYGSRRNKSSRYVAVFEALHDEYNRRPDDFKFNAVGNLTQVIDDKGGVSGIVAARVAANTAEKLQRNGLSAIAQPEDDIEAAQQWVADNALPFLKNAPSIAWSSALTPGSLTWDDDGHALVSVRRNAGGNIEYGPTSNSASALEAIAVDDVSKIRNVQDLPLRLLAEVTATQSYPGKFCPSGSRANLTGPYGNWYPDVYLDEGTASHGLPVKRRLVIRQGDILLSAMQTDSSIVTIFTPTHSLLLPTDPDVYLDPNELRLIEEWYETGTLFARKATPTYSLQRAIRSRKADWLLRVTNKASKKACVLHFRSIDRADDDPVTSRQADLKLFNYKPTWKLAARHDWFVRLQRDFFDKWFEMVRGNQLRRREHWLFNIDVTSATVTICFKHDQAGRFASETIGLGRPHATKAKVKRSGVSFSVSAKDFAPVFYNLARLEIVGPVKISGDDAVVLLKFKIASGKYLIAIPTATASKNGVIRNPKHMTRYGKAVI
jgi:hypothetical protein